MDYADRLMAALRAGGVEFRRGSAGGGNQLRQPYLKSVVPPEYYKQFPETEHIHFYGFYIGNFPDLGLDEVDDICSLINSVN
jgi:dTDP-4-amino-4,6-dideoxygalactose transaminase